MPRLWLKVLEGKGEPLRRKMFWERLGFVAPPAGAADARILIDANGHGEYGQVHTFLRQFRERYPAWTVILVSWNPEIVELAGRNPSIDHVVFMPWDVGWIARRFFRALAPKVYVTVDQLRMPAVLRAAKALGVRTMLVSASFPDVYVESEAMKRASAFQFHRDLDRICVADEEARASFRRIGCDADRLRLTGYMKYDLEHLRTTEEDRRALRRSLGVEDGEPIWVAGSVRPGEVHAVVDAYARARRSIPNLRFLLAPRYVPDADGACQAAADHGLAWVRRTALTPGGAAAGDAVIVLDTYGELSRLYAIADVVFVGNSLVPADRYALGQNLAEPLVHGMPVVFGPHMNKWRAVTSLLKDAWPGVEAADSSELATSVVKLLQNTELRTRVQQRVAEVVARNRGAVERNFAALVELIEPS